MSASMFGSPDPRAAPAARFEHAGMAAPVPSAGDRHVRPSDPTARGLAAPDPRSAARETARGRAAWRDLVETVALTLVIAVGIQVAVQSRQIEGTSMEPTLHDGQRLLVNRLAYVSPNEPQRGDIVVFHAWDQDDDYIKRVVGVPGDAIEIRDDHISINGFVLDEPYIANAPTFGASGAIVLGPDEYYVLGDNRGNSSDSRMHGPLPADKIVGKAWVSYWPIADAGVISDSTSYAAAGP